MIKEQNVRFKSNAYIPNKINSMYVLRSNNVYLDNFHIAFQLQMMMHGL